MEATLTLQCEAMDTSSCCKLWVTAIPRLTRDSARAWPKLFELLVADTLCLTGCWRVLQERYDRHHGYSRVVARGYVSASELV